jgi:hypothetical protein
LLEDNACDFRLGLLAVGVQLVQFGGQGAGPIRVLRQKHFDHIRGAGHAPRCVDPRSHSEGHLAGAGRIAFRESGNVQQRS